MKIKKIEILRNITFFELATDSAIIYKDDKHRLWFRQKAGSGFLISDSGTENLVFNVEDFVLFTSYSSNTPNLNYRIMIFQISSGSLKSFLENSLVKAVLGTSLLIDVTEEGVKSTSLVDLMNREVIWKVPFNFQLKFKGNEILLGISGRNSRVIYCLDIATGQNVWQYDCEKLGEWVEYDNRLIPIRLYSILGIFNDTAWMILTNGKLLLLDSKTGEEKDVVHNDKNINETFMSGWFRQGLIHMDEKQGKLIQLADQFYTEVDLQTRDVSHQQVQDMIDIDLKNQSAFSFDEENIYFIDTTNFKMGVLARKTLKITWSYTFDQSDVNLKEERPRMPQELKLAENSVYVLDNKRTLHVFEEVGENSGTEKIF